MSHSYKHTPKFHFCSDKSSKWYKKSVWHSERTLVRNAISHGEYEKIEARQRIFDDWASPGDGRFYANIKTLDKKFMRK